MMSAKPVLLLLVGSLFGFSMQHWLEGEKGGGENRVAQGAKALAQAGPGALQAEPSPGTASPPDDLGAINASIHQSRRNAIVDAAEKASPSVVSITVKRSQVVAYRNPYYADPFFDFFPPEYRKKEFSSMGSGVLVTKEGYLLTNAHVVGAPEEGGAIEQLTVTLADGRRFPAQLVGMDADIDLAVLRIQGDDLPVAELQSSPDNLIGEWVVAIGNPYGYLIGDTKPTVTVGVISAVGRTFSNQSGIHYHNMIQTDASINPGNSGGALVNAQGQVIGINTFIFTGGGQTQGSIGLGFAQPIQKAKLVMDELIRYGYIRQFTTGLFTDPYVNLKIPGMLVTGVEKDSPAAKAGLEKGDIITRVAGKQIRNFHDIQDIFKLFQVGESVSIEYNRGGKNREAKMVLEEAKPKGKVY